MLRVVDAETPTNPNANIPTVLVPAAAPSCEACVAAVALPLVSPEYVYLLRVVDVAPMRPNAKIPTVLFPVAAPQEVTVVAAVALPLISPDYVYLLRFAVLIKPQQFWPTIPNAKTPTVLFPAA